MSPPRPADEVNPWLRGIMAGLATGAVVAVLPPEVGLGLLALLLAFAAAVYVGFTLPSGEAAETGGTEEAGEIGLQWIVALGFTGVALLGLWVSPLFLVAGWILHAGWDWLHHGGRRKTRTASWYPPACLIYDPIAAVLVAWVWMGRG